MIKVYSHPRSGTHFLEAFLAKNFYRTKALRLAPIKWGHWSNRKERTEGNPFGQLFGSHRFPYRKLRYSVYPRIYIYRDGRAVAWSLWNSKGFLPSQNRPSTFSEFLRTPLDWRGTPGQKADTGWTIAEHWYRHVAAWHQYWMLRKTILRFEDLKKNPEKVYRRILKKHFPLRYIKTLFSNNRCEIKTIQNAVGLQPNEASIDAWKAHFSTEDDEYFKSKMPDTRYLYDE